MFQDSGMKVTVTAGDGPMPAADNLIKDTTTQTFVKDVIEESKRQPVLIDFWAPWCGPCKQLTPILEKAVKAAKGKVKLVKMNIDEHPAVPGQMGIQSIPAVIAFVNGQPADGFMGALPESQVILENPSVRVTVLTFAPSGATGRHQGIEAEIGIVIEGELTVEGPTGRQVLRPGGVYWMPGLTPHDVP